MIAHKQASAAQPGDQLVGDDGSLYTIETVSPCGRRLTITFAQDKVVRINPLTVKRSARLRVLVPAGLESGDSAEICS